MSPENETAAPTEKGEMKTLELEVAFGDCDPAGIVFYPNYFKWFDQATWRLFTSVGLTLQVLSKRYKLVGHPLVKAGIVFSAPATVGDRLTVFSRVARWGNRSFEVAHRIVKSDGRVAVEGSETRVMAMVDPEAPSGMRAIRIPDEIIARLGGTRDQAG